jgi:chaperonin GroEL (HSP60 family)
LKNESLALAVPLQVVAGGGAVESALSVYLEYLATTLGSREQLAIAEFAESLLIIPKVWHRLLLLYDNQFPNGANVEPFL